MTIPYRTRRACKKLFTFLLVLLLIAVFVLLCWLLWLDRFLVYTKGGAYLDFSQSNKLLSGQLSGTRPSRPTVPIHYGDDDIEKNSELTQMIGFYITTEDLKDNIDGITEQVKKLPVGTPVLVDVKNITGRFFYSSSVSDKRLSAIDPVKMDILISAMTERNLYAIARLPAFRDYYFGLNNVPAGLPTSGGYLWMDADRCYWLNPASQGAITYLAQILTELRGLGFDEAVFYDFRFPDTDSIVFKGDKKEALATAANTLVTACATDTFAVSFIGDASFALPEGRTRLYVQDIAAADCESYANKIGLPNPQVNLVFFAQSHDTRYDKYSVLRPLAEES